MRAAVGFRVHSGWAAMVAMADELQVIDRRRITCIDEAVAGAKQPYHFVEKMPLREAERHLADCAAVSNLLALEALHSAVRDLSNVGFTVTVAAILEAAGRPLPDLAGILPSHALIHTAEGEFFRAVFRHACYELKIPVKGIRERDLSSAPPRLRAALQGLGRALGPPWAQDQKFAAMAASMVLSAHAAAGL